MNYRVNRLDNPSTLYTAQQDSGSAQPHRLISVEITEQSRCRIFETGQSIFSPLTPVAALPYFTRDWFQLGSFIAQHRYISIIFKAKAKGDNKTIGPKQKREQK